MKASSELKSSNAVCKEVEKISLSFIKHFLEDEDRNLSSNDIVLKKLTKEIILSFNNLADELINLKQTMTIDLSSLHESKNQKPRKNLKKLISNIDSIDAIEQKRNVLLGALRYIFNENNSERFRKIIKDNPKYIYRRSAMGKRVREIKKDNLISHFVKDVCEDLILGACDTEKTISNVLKIEMNMIKSYMNCFHKYLNNALEKDSNKPQKSMLNNIFNFSCADHNLQGSLQTGYNLILDYYLNYNSHSLNSFKNLIVALSLNDYLLEEHLAMFKDNSEIMSDNGNKIKDDSEETSDDDYNLEEREKEIRKIVIKSFPSLFQQTKTNNINSTQHAIQFKK